MGEVGSCYFDKECTMLQADTAGVLFMCGMCGRNEIKTPIMDEVELVYERL